MADGLGFSEGSGATVATDDAGSSGHVQIIKLAISTDGSATIIPADATYGLDVDVTRVASVTPGTGATDLGKAEDAVAASGDVGVAVLAVRTDTAAASSGTDGDYEPLHTDDNGNLRTTAIFRDSDDDAVTLAKPLAITATPTLTTVTYAAGEVMGTVMSFADAAAFSAGTGHLTRVTIIDNDDLAHDGTNGQYAVHFFTTTVTVTNDAALAVASDAEAETYVGSAYTTDGTWVDLGVAKVCTIRMGPPLAYKCAATTLFGVLQAITLDSGASSAGGRDVVIQVSRD